jgi:hypothetical protein
LDPSGPEKAEVLVHVERCAADHILFEDALAEAVDEAQGGEYECGC